MNSLIKKIYYTLVNPRLAKDYTLSLGFIFHTEKIHDEVVFSRLLRFCKEYQSITGKRALCTVMPPESLRVKNEMQQAGATEADFIRNLNLLQTVADLGFHGHFWRSAQKDFEAPDNQIRNSTYQAVDDKFIAQQFHDQLRWFQQSGFTDIKSYAAGWWFMHRAVIQNQASHGIGYDFSLSKVPWTSGTWGKTLMQENHIAFGEPVVVELPEGKINCVQTVMGAPNTPFPQDFIRIINTLLEPENNMPIGMITTHDYDLMADRLVYAIDLIRYLKTKNYIQFFSIDDLPALLGKRELKKVTI